MKNNRPYPIVHISKKGERSILSGHPWVYDTEVSPICDCVKDGDLVDVISERGKYLATGFLNRASKIRVRILSRNANDRFDAAFWRRRITYAWEYRKAVMQPADLDCCRLIFGEADFMPGLTVDRFGPILVTQTVCLGMERIKPLLFPLIRDVLLQDGQQIDAIYERNDLSLRQKEGLPQSTGFFPLAGAPAPDRTCVSIVENGIQYAVDFVSGQKTGFFLDQKYNRLAVSRISAGRRVLDCFTHIGSFALNAAKGGAAHVTGVDISEAAVLQAEKNAEANGLSDRVDFKAANVFDLLPAMLESGGSPYDMIILDPPAFTKSRATVQSAARGYKEINFRAIKLLPRGGYLATCSCSHFMTPELFFKTILSAASDAGRTLRQIEARQQAPDHPILPCVDETNYLKFYLFQVV